MTFKSTLAVTRKNIIKRQRPKTREGFDFTGAECISWLTEAGFAETRVEPLVGPDSMIIAVK